MKGQRVTSPAVIAAQEVCAVAFEAPRPSLPQAPDGFGCGPGPARTAGPGLYFRAHRSFATNLPTCLFAAHPKQHSAYVVPMDRKLILSYLVQAELGLEKGSNASRNSAHLSMA